MRGPAEGDLIEIDGDEAAVGYEQKGRRPAIVVSIDEFQQTGLAIVCPITTHGGKTLKPRSDLEIAIPPGFSVSGVILSHQLKTVDWKSRNSTVLDHLPRATLLNVRARLRLFLGL